MLDTSERKPTVDRIVPLLNLNQKKYFQVSKVHADQYNLVLKQELLAGSILAQASLDLVKIYARADADDENDDTQSRIRFRLSDVKSYEILSNSRLALDSRSAALARIFHLDEVNAVLKIVPNRMDRQAFMAVITIEMATFEKDPQQQSSSTRLSLLFFYVNEDILKSNLVNFELINKYFNSASKKKVSKRIVKVLCRLCNRIF